MKNIIQFFLLMIFSVLSLQSQISKEHLSNSTGFIINTEKPSIYITFERKGKRPAPGDDVTDNAIWLRLYNNTRSDISFCAFDVSSQKSGKKNHNEAIEISVRYDVEITNSRLFDIRAKPVPVGTGYVNVCHWFTLSAGKDIVFNVAEEHLAKGLSIKVPFRFEWERVFENNPVHLVYFNSKYIPL